MDRSTTTGTTIPATPSRSVRVATFLLRVTSSRTLLPPSKTLLMASSSLLLTLAPTLSARRTLAGTARSTASVTLVPLIRPTLACCPSSRARTLLLLMLTPRLPRASPATLVRDTCKKEREEVQNILLRMSGDIALGTSWWTRHNSVSLLVPTLLLTFGSLLVKS